MRAHAMIVYRRLLCALLFGAMILAASGEDSHAASSQAAQVKWRTGCELSSGESLGMAMRGMGRLRIATPCKNLIVHSQYTPAFGNKKQGKVPQASEFRTVLVGHVNSWTWKLAIAPALAAVWPTHSAPPGTKNDGTFSRRGPDVSWPLLFTKMFAIYRYVLNESPPPTKFKIYFFPSELKLNRTVTTSTHDFIVMPLFYPYGLRSAVSSKPGAPRLTALQTSYFFVMSTAGFEYMHALFLTKRLKVPNTLSHSVADRVASTALQIMEMSDDPHASITLPAVKSIRAFVSKKRRSLLRGDVDEYGGLLAVENMAHVLGGDTMQVTIRAGDKTKLLKLLKLARAMLQQPVDFTKQQLYPLDRLDSVPAYTGTPADISAKH